MSSTSGKKWTSSKVEKKWLKVQFLKPRFFIECTTFPTQTKIFLVQKLYETYICPKIRSKHVFRLGYSHVWWFWKIWNLVTFFQELSHFFPFVDYLECFKFDDQTEIQCWYNIIYFSFKSKFKALNTFLRSWTIIGNILYKNYKVWEFSSQVYNHYLSKSHSFYYNISK